MVDEEGRSSGEQALGSFCLFDTFVVSDCPYYVTGDSKGIEQGKNSEREALGSGSPS